MGIFRLNSRQSQLRAANPDPPETPRVRYWRITRFWWPFSVPPVFFYVALNSFILWGSAEFDSTSADNPTYSLRGKIYPEVVLSLVVVGMAYYFFTFAGAEKRPAQHRIYNWSIINWGGVTCKVDKDGYYDAYLERVYRFGRRRVIKYTVSSGLSRKCRIMTKQIQRFERQTEGFISCIGFLVAQCYVKPHGIGWKRLGTTSKGPFAVGEKLSRTRLVGLLVAR